MAATHDIGVTPRPIYKSDGRKLQDCYTQPLELREELTQQLGPFPLFQFWGAGDDHRCIPLDRRCGLAHQAHTRADADLGLSSSSRLRSATTWAGRPRIATSLADIDEVAGRLAADAERDGARVIVLSEYGITPVFTPIHINRALRAANLLRVRVEDGGDFSMFRKRRRSPSRTTRSPIFTSPTPI